MPLTEPYVSPLLHRGSMRPDPAALPAAGRSQNSPPRAIDAFHRKKLLGQGEGLTHLGADTKVCSNATTVSRESYVEHELPPRRQKQTGVNPQSDGGEIGGLGKSVDGICDTKDWKSTKQITIDKFNQPAPNPSLEKLKTRWSSERGQLTSTQWGSEARTHYGQGDCFEMCKTVLAERAARKAKQGSNRETLQP